MKRTLFCLLSLITSGVLAREPLNFVSQPLTAGRASLVGDGYIFPRTLGEATFSPELRLPVQLIYDSSSESCGLFGYGWSSPQLESSAVPEQNGVVWVTPWGEKIRFTAKNSVGKKGLFSLFASKVKGRGYFALYDDWEADTPAKGKAAASSGDWTFTSKRKYAGWKFVYRNARLITVSAPSGRSLDFSYADGGRLSSVAQDGRAQLDLTYTDGQVSGLTLNGIPNAFVYDETKVLIPPKNPKAGLDTVTYATLASVRTGTLNPVTYAYDDHGYLISARQGDHAETLKVNHETLAERRAKVKDAPVGKLIGILTADSQFSYKRSDKGVVALTDKEGREASYNYDSKKVSSKSPIFPAKLKPYTISCVMMSLIWARSAKSSMPRGARSRVTATIRRAGT